MARYPEADPAFWVVSERDNPRWRRTRGSLTHKVRGWARYGMVWRLARSDCRSWRQRVGKAMRHSAYDLSDWLIDWLFYLFIYLFFIIYLFIYLFFFYLFIYFCLMPYYLYCLPQILDLFYFQKQNDCLVQNEIHLFITHSINNDSSNTMPTY